MGTLVHAVFGTWHTERNGKTSQPQSVEDFELPSIKKENTKWQNINTCSYYMEAFDQKKNNACQIANYTFQFDKKSF